MGNLVLAPRRGSKAIMQTAAKKNIVLAEGELFIENDTGQVRLKVGDGTTKYYQLPYVNSSATTAADVLYDNSVSEIPGAYNVQHAIDITYDKIKDLKAENIPVNKHGHVMANDVQEALEHASEADGTFYDNSTSGLAANDVQHAIDLLSAGSGGGGEYTSARAVDSCPCVPGDTGFFALDLSRFMDLNTNRIISLIGYGFNINGNARYVTIASVAVNEYAQKAYFNFYNSYTQNVNVEVFVDLLLQKK